jgi:hypothetical protein
VTGRGFYEEQSPYNADLMQFFWNREWSRLGNAGRCYGFLGDHAELKLHYRQSRAYGQPIRISTKDEPDGPPKAIFSIALKGQIRVTKGSEGYSVGKPGRIVSSPLGSSVCLQTTSPLYADQRPPEPLPRPFLRFGRKESLSGNGRTSSSDQAGKLNAALCRYFRFESITKSTLR